MKKKIKIHDFWEKRLQERLNAPLSWNMYDVALKKYTKKELIEIKKKEKAEKRRRSKKITMTVGEFEDKLQEAEDRCDY